MSRLVSRSSGAHVELVLDPHEHSEDWGIHVEELEAGLEKLGVSGGSAPAAEGLEAELAALDLAVVGRGDGDAELVGPARLQPVGAEEKHTCSGQVGHVARQLFLSVEDPDLRIDQQAGPGGAAAVLHEQVIGFRAILRSMPSQTGPKLRLTLIPAAP